MFQRLIRIILSITLVIFPCGCADYHEINDTAMVAGIAVDRGSEALLSVSVEIVKPEESQSSPSASVLSIEGDSIGECIAGLVGISRKELQFSHCKLILFSETVANRGIREIVTGLLADPEYRPDVILAVVCGTPAARMLKKGETERKVCSYDYVSVVRNSYRRNGSAPPTMLYQFFMDGDVTLLPAFENGAAGYEVCGSAFFEDGRYRNRIGLLSTQCILLSSDQFQRGTLSIPIDNITTVTLPVDSVSCERSVGENATVSVRLKIRVLRSELTETSQRLGEETLSELVQQTFYDQWSLACAEGWSSAFGLQVYLHRHAPKQTGVWKSQNKEPRLDVACQITVVDDSIAKERTAR